MAEEANLGQWEAREVDSVSMAAPARARTPQREPLPMPAVGPDDRTSPGDSGKDSDRSFWLGVVVGLVPVLLLVIGFIGYRLTRDGDGSTGGETAATATSGSATPTSLTVSTEALPSSSTTSMPATTPTPTVPPEPVVADGVVTDGAIEVTGVLPAEDGAAWIGELADLAAVLGYRLDDRTEPPSDTGPPPASELVVRFPGAVVFRPDSPQSFDGNAQPVFEAIAGVLNRGSADLNVVAYADPGEPDIGILALSRAEHVHEHLVELGVDPDRLTVEARPPVDAPIVAADGSPIDRRADLEFRFRP